MTVYSAAYGPAYVRRLCWSLPDNMWPGSTNRAVDVRQITYPIFARAVLSILGRSVVLVLLSGLLGAALVRLAPGFGIDERELDARFSAASRDALQRERQRMTEAGPIVFYWAFTTGLMRGDAGRSTLFDRPVRDMIAERAGRTVRSVTAGLILGWLGGIGLAVAATTGKRAAAPIAAAVISSSLVSVPSAVLAVICLLLDLPPAIAIAAVVLPQVFSHASEQIHAFSSAPYVSMARARGLHPARVFLFHIAPGTFAPLIALFGLSVSLAFGASIPVEALADSPGLGQLAWQAALGRDLPLLVAISLLITAVTVGANSVAEILSSSLRPSQ
jgi:peptide/nickel transport system permease protein